jgi:UDP-2,4-diacetamido-2,4,6-trideoxy-beta-L-altropyranose hydrolase
MEVIFRTDASSVMGHGHVMRCLTLAKALSERGLRSTFVCKEHAGNLCDLIEQRGFSVVRLPLGETDSPVEKALHSLWLGSSVIEDAESTRTAIEHAGIRPQWLIVDHYALDHQWETILRPMVRQLMVIDDLADRLHVCDVLLDQNFFLNLQQRYSGKTPLECIMLLGPQFALLQPVYAELHAQATPKSSVHRIFMFFGGADTENLTGRAISAFQRLKRSDIHLDVVRIDGGASYEATQKQVSGHSNISLHGSLPSLALLMHKADVAIGAGGATTWERLCLGLPSLVISLAENQEEISMDLAAGGLIRYLGDKRKVSEDDIYQALVMLVDSPSLSGWSVKCSNTCDGKGAFRVADYLQAASITNFDGEKTNKERV